MLLVLWYWVGQGEFDLQVIVMRDVSVAAFFVCLLALGSVCSHLSSRELVKPDGILYLL
jgi:hypothetical protein